MSVQLCIAPSMLLRTELEEQLMTSALLRNLQELKSLEHCCTAQELKNCPQPCHALPCSCFTFNNLCKLINLISDAKEIPTSV